ncbi:DNA cytosine methyltransferase [Yinghuangia aomiensis]|uniref:DNA (cytosine-5-)-methyltransferase n=1 Tax=Yinghuangia aomiensis TaxID=676205 RepID=A0ABP9HU33_9ACTN
MSLTFTDLFCGAGGSSTGLVAAGFELKLAANHWARAIETHAANHPGAEHLCVDVDHYDMRRLPRTDVLWASPICTEISPAGGRRRRRHTKGQLDLLEHGSVSEAGWERTRATAYDVIRATEVHRYKAVLCENVLEFAADWPLFDWWREGMARLGYRSQVVSASSAHLSGTGNLPAPQWRDRIYVVFVREGIPMPDLAPRPPAWCVPCGEQVDAVQSWRNGRTIGKYRQQYDYRCPNTACRHALVEPYVRPAASVIDWTDLGARIGDRTKPLAASTMARIRAGLARFPATRSVLTVNHAGHDGRPYPADAAPFAARTAKIGEGLLVPNGGQWNAETTHTGDPMRTRMANPKGYEALVALPFVVEFRRNATAEPVHAPLATVTAGGNHHGLVMPDSAHGAFYVNNARPQDMARPVADPFGTATATDHHALVVPYRRGHAKPAAEPMLTLATVDSAGLASSEGGCAEVDVEDCHFRMVQPHEQLLAQRFPATYEVKGNKGERTMQAGNAVSVNAAHWLGTRLAEVLA